jgi:phosphoglycolate phosphatase
MLDIDGTLVDTAGELAAAANAALAEAGLPAVAEDRVRRWAGCSAREVIARAYRHASGAKQPDARLARVFEWHYAALSGRRSAPRPDALQALRQLRRNGVSTALVTNKETRFTAPLLHAHDLWQCFDAVVCGDMVERGKPDPLGVEHCLDRFRVGRQRALFVGGSAIDSATALKAGIDLLPTLRMALGAIARAVSA